MRNFTKLMVGFMFIWATLSTNTLFAQDWGTFNNLLSQLDSAKRAEYLDNLGTLQNGNQGVYNYSRVLDSLNNFLLGENPANPGLELVIPADSLVRDSLLSVLGLSGFSALDSLSVLNEFDRINEVWQTRKDSLYNAFDLYKDQLTTVSELPTNYTGQFNQWRNDLDSLIGNQQSAFNTIPALGPGLFEGVFEEMFDANYFTRIEFTAGTQLAKTNYYGQFEDVKAPVFGIRSSEQFDQNWEARWRVQASWFKNVSGVVSESVTQQNSQYNPFMINGGFDMMFSPTIATDIASSPVRLITLLGIEAGTYAPSHRDPSNPLTKDNKGYTTGWGPVVGAGLSMKVGETTIYSLGTTSYGDVICNPGATVAPNYRYRSNRLEAGIRYGNAISVRYEIGLSNNWANDGNKHIRYQQITVGFPTTGLFK